MEIGTSVKSKKDLVCPHGVTRGTTGKVIKIIRPDPLLVMVEFRDERGFIHGDAPMHGADLEVKG